MPKPLQRDLTTREVGRLVGVHLKTVYNWIERGDLKAYRTPGNHRRVRPEDLVEFMTSFGMPIPDELWGMARRRILVADDDPMVATLVERLLAQVKAKIEIRSTQDGMETLMELGRRRHDLLILDIYMPELSGFEVCRRIKSNPEFKHMRVLAISAKADEKVRAEIQRCGAESFMAKPLRPGEFLAEVCRLLEITPD